METYQSPISSIIPLQPKIYDAGGGQGNKTLTFDNLSKGQQDMFLRSIHKESDYQIAVRGQENRQLLVLDKEVILTVHIVREDFPEINTDILVTYTRSTMQQSWYQLLRNICKELKIDFVFCVVDRLDKSPVSTVKRLRDKGEYAVRQRESSAILEVIQTGLPPVEISWPITKDINSAKQSLTLESKTFPQASKRVKSLTAKPLTREKQREVATAVMDSLTAEEAIRHMDGFHRNVLYGDAYARDNFGQPVPLNAREYGEIEKYDFVVDIVTLHRLCLEKIDRLALTHKRAGKEVVFQGFRYIEAVIIGLRAEVDIITVAMKLLSDLMRYLTPYRDKLFHLILDTIQLYSPPPTQHRIRNPKRSQQTMSWANNPTKNPNIMFSSPKKAIGSPGSIAKSVMMSKRYGQLIASTSAATAGSAGGEASAAREESIKSLLLDNNNPIITTKKGKSKTIKTITDVLNLGKTYDLSEDGADLNVLRRRKNRKLVLPIKRDNSGKMLDNEENKGEEEKKEKNTTNIDEESEDTHNLEENKAPLVLIFERVKSDHNLTSKRFNEAFSPKNLITSPKGRLISPKNRLLSPKTNRSPVSSPKIKQRKSHESREIEGEENGNVGKILIESGSDKVSSIKNKNAVLPLEVGSNEKKQVSPDLKKKPVFKVKIKPKTKEDDNSGNAGKVWKGSLGEQGRAPPKELTVRDLHLAELRKSKVHLSLARTKSKTVSNDENPEKETKESEFNSEINPKPSFDSIDQEIDKNTIDVQKEEKNEIQNLSAIIEESMDKTLGSEELIPDNLDIEDNKTQESVEDGLNEDSLLTYYDPNNVEIKPLPEVPCVVFRGFKDKIKQKIALLQAFSTLFKMTCQNFGNRDAAFKMGIIEEISEIVTVCQAMPRVLEMYVWIIDKLYDDGFKGLDEKQTKLQEDSDSDKEGDPSMQVSDDETDNDDDDASDAESDISEPETKNNKTKKLELNEGSLTGESIDIISEMSIPTIDADGNYSEITPIVNMGVIEEELNPLDNGNKTQEVDENSGKIMTRAKKKKAKKRKKKGKLGNNSKNSESPNISATPSEEEIDKKVFGEMVDGDAKSDEAVALISRVKKGIKVPMKRNKAVFESIGLFEFEARYVKRPSDITIAAMAMCSSHSEIHKTHKDLASQWIETWNDNSREFYLMRRKGYDIAGL